MKYLLLSIHELFSVYLICSASKQSSQVEANLNAGEKRAKSVTAFSPLCIHSQILFLFEFFFSCSYLFCLLTLPDAACNLDGVECSHSHGINQF